MKTKILRISRVYLSSFFLVSALYSCSKGDKPSEDMELSNASGTYILTELNVSPAQDINGDGMASINLLDELNCISASLSLRADGSYALNLTGIEVITIPNGRFFIACANPRNSDSNWNIQNGMITLFSDVTITPYTLVGDELTRTLGQDLPGIQSVIYVKQ